MKGLEMEFRTTVELPVKQTIIQHSDKIMLMGSCFAENIGKMFIENKFVCTLNPYGILYNPMSIACALDELLRKKSYTERDPALVEYNGWHSLHHHGAFSAQTRRECVQNINEKLKQTYMDFFQTDVLLITWGTAWIYKWGLTGEIVANCHKIPASSFVRERLDVHGIVQTYESLVLRLLTEVNPELKIIFTVSPVRHAKDGFHENQLSKSILLLAIESLQKKFPGTVSYFPSYEIMMDELRDYRFYADDMLHPSQLAQTYIWQRFDECCFSDECRRIIGQWNEIKKGLSHRPFHPESPEYREFLCQIVLKMTQLKEKYPYFEVKNEMELCRTLLKQ